jgi:CBS domain containing-hemolysin-like protein
VVNTNGEVIGVLSVKDIAKELIKTEKKQPDAAAAAAAASSP